MDCRSSGTNILIISAARMSERKQGLRNTSGVYSIHAKGNLISGY